jgi:hypothetical protein
VEVLLTLCKDVGLEGNAKNKYMFVSPEQSVGQNHKGNVDYKPLEYTHTVGFTLFTGHEGPWGE